MPLHSHTSQAAPVSSQATPFGIVGSADVIRELICGPLQHNEHCKGWRWHLYTRDDAKRFDAVNAELVKMREERRAARRSNIIQMAAE